MPILKLALLCLTRSCNVAVTSIQNHFLYPLKVEHRQSPSNAIKLLSSC